ncbi:MAG: tRNA 2-thiouridine(34) synthase MnmA, partial [Actinobacteria bacterium]|nr:tRNA 2-thiouridine(34) synthase MnmA [Actinomycetota bacterium]
MKVLVAMSGGVDSSVAAAELKAQGHDVVGVTMRLWGGESDTGCCSVSDVDDARRVAQQLGIDHLVFNFSDDFDTH